MKEEIYYYEEIEETSIPQPASVPRPPRHAKFFRSAGRFCLFAIALVVPFFFLPVTQDPVGVNKFTIVSILALLGLACFLGCVFEERKLEYPRSWFFLFLILIVADYAAGAFFSIAPAVSWYGYLSQPDSFLSIGTCALVFFLTFFFFENKDIRKVGALLGIGLLVASAIGLLALAGFIQQPNPTGSVIEWGILMIAGVAALAGANPAELRPGQKRFFFAFGIVAAIVLFLLNYQFLWLAVAVFTIMLAALRFEPKQQFRYAFVVIVLALFFTLVGPRLPALVSTPADLRPGVAATGAVAQGTLRGWKIILGSGPATFSYDYALFRPASINQTSFWNMPFSEGYDFILTLLATGGLLGLLLFLGMIAALGRWFLEIQRFPTDRAMLLSAAAFLALTLFFYPAFFAGLAILFVLLGLFSIDEPRREISFARLSRGSSFVVSILVMILAAASLALIYSEGQQYVAAVAYGQSSALAASGNTDAALTKVQTAIVLAPSDVYFRGASQIFLAKAQQVVSTPNLAPTVADAVQAAQNATTLNPADPENWGNLGSVYESVMPVASGADVLAEQSYQKAADLDPENPEWDLAIGRVFTEAADLLPADASQDSVREADWAQAEVSFEKALSLKDDYADPRIALINLYIKEGNTTQAIQRVQELEQQNPLDPGVAFELGYLYYQSNQLTSAQQEFQVAAILEPDYVNARYYLGLVDAQQGMTAQALQQFNAALELSPGNQQITTAIANLQAGQPVPAATTSSTVGTPQIAVPKSKTKN